MKTQQSPNVLIERDKMFIILKRKLYFVVKFPIGTCIVIFMISDLVMLHSVINQPFLNKSELILFSSSL